MVPSYRFRRVFLWIGYTVLVASSLGAAGTLTPPAPWFMVLRVFGAVLFAASVLAAVWIHSMFPPRHDRPEDFEELMTSGPYAYCRHPFYLALMVNQFSLPILFLSLTGLIVYLLLLPLWLMLIKLEERELLEYWGERYREYMRRVPMLIPRPWRRRGGEKG